MCNGSDIALAYIAGRIGVCFVGAKWKVADAMKRR
jgi:hypothetical protein